MISDERLACNELIQLCIDMGQPPERVIDSRPRGRAQEVVRQAAAVRVPLGP